MNIEYRRSGDDCLGQVYLALSYLELHVGQQEMLKKKTEVSLIMNIFNLYYVYLSLYIFLNYAGKDDFFKTTYQEQFMYEGNS